MRSAACGREHLSEIGFGKRLDNAAAIGFRQMVPI
jgi:hypothetical protein